MGGFSTDKLEHKLKASSSSIIFFVVCLSGNIIVFSGIVVYCLRLPPLCGVYFDVMGSWLFAFSDKASGLDGYNFAFLKRYWDIFKQDIFEFVFTFLNSKKMPSGANSSFITLIPKITKPIHIKDYRPISLIGIHYKIIANILCNRLSFVIDKLISHEQTAFIKGRQILDGPLILSELIEWYKKRKKKMLLFKVDFEKAFDTRWRMFSNSSALWVNVIKPLHRSDRGFGYNGCSSCDNQVRFWKDIWLSSSPLCTRFNTLFHLEQDKDCLITDRIANDQLVWNWSSNLGVQNIAHLSELLLDISLFNIQVDTDKCLWSLDKEGTLALAPLRRLIDDITLSSLDSSTSWDNAIPRRLN
nr:RNA-directed DNA polymerase, eukaryota, reverse transcriptase zinc-binding domain protein [Tanacetum cinerariifolium]